MFIFYYRGGLVGLGPTGTRPKRGRRGEKTKQAVIWHSGICIFDGRRGAATAQQLPNVRFDTRSLIYVISAAACCCCCSLRNDDDIRQSSTRRARGPSLKFGFQIKGTLEVSLASGNLSPFI